MLNDTQIDLLQSSFALVRPIADTAGMLFYERIFTIAPEARDLFGDDLPRQAARTMGAVGTVVDGLRDLDQVVPFLVRLGARHAHYGVQAAHFDVVGEALLWTLEQGLGSEFTQPVREAWTVAYGIIADTMLAAMLEEQTRYESLSAASV
jgi:hemoglobin-like flavoprotein